MMMNLAGVDAQIWITIVVFIAAAAIPLTLDFLMRRNNALRQATAGVCSVRERPEVNESSAAAQQHEFKAFIAVAAEKAARKMAAEQSEIVANVPEARNLEGVKPRAALSEWLNKRAAQNSAAPAAAPQPPAVEIALTAEPDPSIEAAATQPQAAVEANSEPAASQTQSDVDVFVDEPLLEAILSGSSVLPKAAEQNGRPRFEVIKGSGPIPAGMHTAGALRRLLDANKPYTGLVFALTVTNGEGGAASHGIVLSVHNFVRSLLHEGDFACQTGAGEFVLLSPGEEVAQSKLRLNGISERLWDFQVRGVGDYSVLFSWGDVLVRREPLAEAVDSASERMYQTLRARKTVSMDFVAPRTTAV